MIPCRTADTKLRPFFNRSISSATSTSSDLNTEEEGEQQTFGVKFDTSMEKYWTQLTPVIQALLKETDKNEVAD